MDCFYKTSCMISSTSGTKEKVNPFIHFLNHQSCGCFTLVNSPNLNRTFIGMDDTLMIHKSSLTLSYWVWLPCVHLSAVAFTRLLLIFPFSFILSMSRDIAVGLQLSGSQLVLVVGVGVMKGELRERKGRWAGCGREAAVLLAVGWRKAGRRMVAPTCTTIYTQCYLDFFSIANSL